MNAIYDIRNSIQSMKAEALGENRPYINREFLNEMISAYERLTFVDLSSDKDNTIRMLHVIWNIKRFLELDEPVTAQSYMRGLVNSVRE